jgi:hypothetical protein
MSARITCSCGKELRVFAHHAGKPMHCPACGVLLTMPADLPAEGSPALPAEQRRRPVWPWLAGSVLVLLGAGLAWWFLGRSGANAQDPSDLDFVPPNASGFVRGRVAAIWQTEAGRQAIEKVRQQNPRDEPLAWLEQNLGLRPEGIDRLTGAFIDPDRYEHWFVLRTVDPYDRRALLGRLKGGQEERHEGQTYYVGETKDGKELAVYFAGRRVLVAGPKAGMRRCLAFRAGPRGSGPLDPVLERAAGDDHVIGAYNPTAAEVDPTSKQRQRMVDRVPEALKPLRETRFATFSANFGDTSQLDAKLTFAAEDKARASGNAIESTLRTIKLLLAFRAAGVRPADLEGKKALRQQRELLNAVRVQQKGKDVDVSLKGKGSVMVEGAASLFSALRPFLPR